MFLENHVLHNGVLINIYPRGGKYTREEVLELSHPKELKKLKLMHS